MSAHKRWPSQAVLDALRPEPGWAVKAAFLASYSADLPSIAAALLALAGRDDEGGSGSKADLAEAIEQLRGKVCILIQRGRLAKLRQIPPIAGILDQFLQEVAFDERQKSWHPKLMLVKFVRPDATPSWRLWFGSRNLTRVENRDIGFLAVGHRAAEARGVPIPGIGKLGQQLADRARLDGVVPSHIQEELDLLDWRLPVGIKMEHIVLTTGDGPGQEPTPPVAVDEVIAVSPFIDGTFVAKLSRWGDARTTRTLLSTLPELKRIAGNQTKPLAGFANRILALEAPEAESAEPAKTIPGQPDTLPVEDAAVDEEEGLGLHAKIIAARKGKKLRLWIGSANATSRGWGRNAEVIAELIADVSIQEGLRELLGQARPVPLDVLESSLSDEVDAIADRLKEARDHVVGSWTGRLHRDGDLFTIRCDAPPHAPDEGVMFQAGLATGQLEIWPRDVGHLAVGVFSKGRQTELLQLRLSLDGSDSAWMQRVAVTPPLEEGRDHAALARHLGPRAFLEWIAALMEGRAGSEDTDDRWDGPPRDRSPDETGAWLAGGLLTLEDMLACWARDREAFRRADERVRTYLDPIIAEAESEQSVDAHRLIEFRSIWRTVGDELLRGG